MKINVKIEVPNPKQISAGQEKLSKEIPNLLADRIKRSAYVAASKCDLYLYVLIRENRKSDKFSKVTDGLYLGICQEISSDERGTVLETILRNALRKNIVIPEGEKECIVYLSNHEIDTTSFFINESEDKKKMLFYAVEPIYTLDQVVMSPRERRAVMRAITLVKEQQLIYDKWGFSNIDKSRKSIMCFHGVPGTGKSMCAHGVASYLGKKILIGSYAQIESEFVGVGAKNLVELFKSAQEQDAVLFIDEADTFLSRRLPVSNDSSKHYNSMSNELYTLIETFNGCIIFASNHIKDFDPAVISRIIEPIEFKLPDFNARKLIFENNLQTTFPLVGGPTSEAIAELARITDGFSGRDIRKGLQIAYADAALKYKVEQGIYEDEIRIELSDVIDSMNEVKEAKSKITASSGRKKNDLLSRFAASDEFNQRVIQLAAHTLLADGKIEQTEKNLYSQLEATLHVTCPLESEALPSVESITKGIDSNAEKAEILNVMCRMAAIDGDVHPSEVVLIKTVCDIFGLSSEVQADIIEYAKDLSSDFQFWTGIVAKFGISDSEILSKLQQEYSEGASYYRMSQIYNNGSKMFGGIAPNQQKADKYEKLAVECGYIKSEVIDITK